MKTLAILAIVLLTSVALQAQTSLTIINNTSNDFSIDMAYTSSCPPGTNHNLQSPPFSNQVWSTPNGENIYEVEVIGGSCPIVPLTLNATPAGGLPACLLGPLGGVVAYPYLPPCIGTVSISYQSNVGGGTLTIN
ncbi:hypothetical protein KFE98_04890 [bacterium SCSIO 12741]|nr:hypothetical protein KFE98_04890 [bacterium SCSIO 12741]